MRELMLIVHFIGLTMSLGTGFANIFLSIAAARLEPADRGVFMSRAMILTRMGHIGLGLLLLSGFYLITPYWKSLADMPVLIAKLTFVAILVILVGVVTTLARRAVESRNFAKLAKLRPFGMIIFFVGITIVVLAVLTFH